MRAVSTLHRALVAVVALAVAATILVGTAPGGEGDSTTENASADSSTSTSPAPAGGEPSSADDAAETVADDAPETGADAADPTPTVAPVVAEPRSGPSAEGVVRLSAEGEEALTELDAVLKGDLPEPRVIEEDGLAEPVLVPTGTSTDGLSLDGPADWQPGQPIEIAVRTTSDDVVGLEAVLSHDDEALEFAGIDRVDGGVQLLINNQGPTVSVGALACSANTCEPGSGGPAPIDELRIRFMPTGEQAAHRLAIDQIRLVGADGSVSSPGALAVTVGGGEPSPVGSAPWSLAPVDRVAPASIDELDHTLDGRLDIADVSEAVLAWREIRSIGDPCADTGRDRLARHDVNDDGCIDIVDIRTLVASDDLEPLPELDLAVSAPLVGPGAGLSAPGRAAPVQVSAVAATMASLSATLDFDPYTWPSRVGETTHVVDSVGDDSDAQLNDGICATAGGVCTLRAALNQSNADVGPNRIEFNIPGAGPHLIELTDRLPVISDMTGGVTIDGYTQPGAAANTHPTEFQADIRIEIEGQGYGSSDFAAFTITSPENVIRGLSIHTVSFGVHLDEDFALRNHIVGNIIGTDIGATINHPVRWGSEGSGIFLNAGPKYNVIGTPALADRNVLSGNASWGVRMDQGGTDGNIMWNNIVGLTPDGQSSLANNGGIDVQWRASFNVIGGLNEGERNVFSGSDYTGIDFSHQSTDNYALGNLMGTTLDGTSYNTQTDNQFGVILKDDAHYNYIIGNVLSNSRDHGVWNKHNYTQRNTIVDNYVGLTIDGNPAGNRDWGMVVRGQNDIIENNHIAHNRDGGIYLDSNNGGGANGNLVSLYNRISRNSFYENDGLGIDIRPTGQNTNDPGDTDSGTNDLLNHPVFSSLVVGQVSGSACAGCEVEVYLADENSSDTQGQQYLGTAITDGAGSFTFADANLVSARRVTMLAIDTMGNTSEFTPYQVVSGGGGNPDLPEGDGLPDPGVVPTPDPTPPSTGGRLETATATVADAWTPITFAGSFISPIAVCTPRRVNNTVPVVVRMQNLTTTGMEIRLQNPGDLTVPVADTVDCLVAEEGAWTLPDGTKMEARQVDLTTPNFVGSWEATQIQLSETFSSPLVVLGQVMTANDPAWSVFWSRGNAPQNAPTPTNLRVGYHVGEDPNTTRAGERIGVIAFDAANGTLGGVEYESGRTADIITGPVPVTHTFATPFTAAPTVLLASQSAMDGPQGGWVTQQGAISATSVDLVIEEDQVADQETDHPTEMVGYLALAGPLQLTWGADPGFQPGLVAFDDFERTTEEYWGVAVFGGAWETLFGPTAREQFSGNGRGNVIVTPGTGYNGLLKTVHQRDVDASLIASVDTDPDANFDVNVEQRWIDSGTFYRGRVRIQADNRVRVQIVRADGGTFTSLGAITLPLTYTTGTDLAIRMQTIGTGTTTVRLKVWEASQPEPVGWSIELDDSSPGLQEPGAFGLRFQINSSSAVPSAMFSVDDILVINTPS